MYERRPIARSVSRSRWMLTRRDALKLAIAAGVASLPAVAGGRLVLDSNGRPMPSAPIFVADNHAQRVSPLLIAYPDHANPVVWQEILRVEGLPYAHTQRLAALDPSQVASVAVVMMLPGATTDDQIELLRDYVEAGGGLVAVQPDAKLAPLCGLTGAKDATSDGYLCVWAGATGAEGIASGALQFHAALHHYQLREAEAVAYLCSRDGVASQTPAVAYRRLGRGAVATWCYDLAQSIVYTRQGPPAHAGVEADGLEGLRACDMFVDFIDLDRIHLPQADEQQRLLVNLLNEVSATPLPRLWYFPANADSVLVCTGDSHNNPAPVVDEALRRVEHFGGTMSIYYTPLPTSTGRRAMRRMRAWADEQPVLGELVPQSDVVTPYHADAWRARGHEFALHPYVEDGLEIGWARYWQQFTGLGYGEFDSTRTHRVLWHGWTDTARVQAAYAVRMNLDYYHVGPAFQRDDGTWAFGYFTGSGLPMRFVDAEGRLIDNWQQNTHLVDEQVIEMPWGANFVGSTPDEAIEIADGLIRRAVSGAYAALGAQFHFDPFAVPGAWRAGAALYREGVLASCVENGLPILSAARWLDFSRNRAAAHVDAFSGDAERGRLSFTIQHAVAPGDLILLLPVQKNMQQLVSLQADRKQIPFKTRKVGATLYAMVALEATETAIDARYATE